MRCKNGIIAEIILQRRIVHLGCFFLMFKLPIFGCLRCWLFWFKCLFNALFYCCYCEIVTGSFLFRKRGADSLGIILEVYSKFFGLL